MVPTETELSKFIKINNRLYLWKNFQLFRFKYFIFLCNIMGLVISAVLNILSLALQPTKILRKEGFRDCI
jgi:hypothetical protein